ncbi:MAG: ribosome maturation factor RimP [Holophagales bacterium]|jgi:ribosome maturation factor RimP|nr:ribosome maturation factor RimP [Holophagales bacterium]
MDLKKISGPIESQLSLLGFELVLLEPAKSGQGEVLRLYIDHLDHSQPITLDDCAALHEGLLPWLDVEFPSFRETYGIEVSSPGMERPLAAARHFQRFLGRLCKVKTLQPINGQKSFKGWINNVSASAVTLEEDGALKSVPLELIQKANLAPFDEEKAPKPKHTPHMVDELVGAEKSAAKEA